MPAIRHPWKIGFALGIGILAKAVFIPASLALLVWLLIINYQINRSQSVVLHANFLQIKRIFYDALIFGGWWYLERWLYFGYPGVSLDMIRLATTNGFWVELSKHFSWSELLSALYGIFTSWHWRGSGSMVNLPLIAMLPVLVLGALFLVSGVNYIFRQSFKSIDWFFLLLAIFLAGFLTYHALLSIALYKTTHWRQYGVYLQDFMPATVWLLTGLLCFYKSTIRRWQLISGFLILGIFQIFATWSLWAVYAGCAIKGADRQIEFTQPYLCLTALPKVWGVNSILTDTSFTILCLSGLLLIWIPLCHMAITHYLRDVKPRTLLVH